MATRPRRQARWWVGFAGTASTRSRLTSAQATRRQRELHGASACGRRTQSGTARPVGCPPPNNGYAAELRVRSTIAHSDESARPPCAEHRDAGVSVGNARRTSKRPSGRSIGRGHPIVAIWPRCTGARGRAGATGGAPARPRPGTGYPPRAPTCLRALTCSPPQRAFVCAISLGLQISERRVGVNGRRPDREDKPDRSRALWAIDLMLADGVNAEPRASPPTKLAAIQRHAHRIPINAAYQPTARRRTARIDCSCQDCVTRLRREVGFAR